MVARICASEGGGRTAFAALKRYVFQGSMRHPRRGSSLGRHFRKSGLLIRVARTIFLFCNTSRMKTSFFHRIGQNAKSVENCSRFFRLEKPHVSAERCRKNQPSDFHSGFVGTIGRQNMCYSLVAAHDSKTEEEFPMIFFVFSYQT